jgi:hypothetical protein
MGNAKKKSYNLTAFYRSLAKSTYPIEVLYILVTFPETQNSYEESGYIKEGAIQY